MKKKERPELPKNALHILVTQPTPMPVEESQVFRVFAVAQNKGTGESVAQLVGPIQLPDGVHHALERLIAWAEWAQSSDTVGNPYGVYGDAPLIAEDTAKVKWWYEAMKGKDVQDAQTSETA